MRHTGKAGLAGKEEPGTWNDAVGPRAVGSGLAGRVKDSVSGRVESDYRRPQQLG